MTVNIVFLLNIPSLFKRLHPPLNYSKIQRSFWVISMNFGICWLAAILILSRPFLGNANTDIFLITLCCHNDNLSGLFPQTKMAYICSQIIAIGCCLVCIYIFKSLFILSEKTIGDNSFWYLFSDCEKWT